MMEYNPNMTLEQKERWGIECKQLATQMQEVSRSEPANQPNLTEIEEESFHINKVPEIPKGAFGADLESAVNVACFGTEANPMAVAIHLVAFVAAHIGHQRYVRIGNDKHFLSFYGLLIGRSGTVKGTAESQASFLESLATQKLIEQYDYKPPATISGLSSGEGLIERLEDPKFDDEDNQVSGITDKRLLCIESEYSNVLAQDQRAGNTLSVVIRDAFDGKTLRSITTNGGRTATSPTLSIIGHITPAEIKRHKSFDMQSLNGALNRYLIFYCIRPQLVANPRQYTEDEHEALSNWLVKTVWAARDGNPHDDYRDKGAGKEVLFSVEAAAIIEREYYAREKRAERLPETLASLLVRHRVYARRLSALFALMDGSNIDQTVQATHVEQAYKWLDYSLASLRYLLSTAKEEAEQEKKATLADKIHEYALTANNGKGISLSDIANDLLKGNIKAGDRNKAIEQLINSGKLKRGKIGRKTVLVPEKT